MTAPGQRLTWSQIHGAVRPRQGCASAFRPIVCAAIATPFVVIAVVSGALLFIAAAAFATFIFLAFLWEALRNAGGSPLVLRGWVTHSGWAWGADGGGLDGPAHRVVYVPRVTIDVRGAWFVNRLGQTRPAPEHLGVCHIDQPQWLSRLAVGEEVALVCLPRSTDPILKLDVATLDASARAQLR